MPDNGQRILVTGASGFVGRYLCEELARAMPGAPLWGTSLSDERPAWAEDLGVEWLLFDIREPEETRRALARVRPTAIIHMAALSHVPTANREPLEAWSVNANGTLNLLEGIRAEVPDSITAFVSSGDVYGRSFRTNERLDEKALPQPENVYSASKAAAELAVRQYGFRGLRTVCLRAFNHVGPGQRPDFVVSAFARQIARIEAGLQAPSLSVGNLEAWRDFTDVRDVVKAYALVLTREAEFKPASVFNVCSGHPRQVSSILDDLLDASSATIRIEQDPERLRPSDTPYAAGDPSKLARRFDWQPRVPWERTIRDTLNDWRERIRSE